MIQRVPRAGNLQALLDAEKEGRLWEFEYTRFGLSAWAHVRWLVAQYLSEALLGSNAVGMLQTGPQSARGKVIYAARALVRHPGLRPRGARKRWPVVFFCSGVGNYQVGDRYRNRLTDYFAGCFEGETLLVEDSAAGTFCEPREFRNVIHHDGILVRAAAEGAARGVSSAEKRRIAEFVGALRRQLARVLPDQAFDAARDKLMKYGSRADSWYSQYARLLDRVEPRLAFVEDGCYGGRSHLVRWLRERGIAVAEYQHGYIGGNHEGYNFDPDMLGSRYRDNLPDHFLTYGRYWGDQIRISSELIPVGNPHLTEQAAELSKTTTTRTVLFAASAYDSNYYRELLPAAAAGLPADVTLVFRPHPIERATAEASYGELFSRCGIVLDREPLAYQSILNAELVIGDASTLLFEAEALGRPVVVLETQQNHLYVPVGLFPFVSDLSRLGEHLRPAGSSAQTPRAELWAPNWRENYRAFAERFLS